MQAWRFSIKEKTWSCLGEGDRVSHGPCCRLCFSTWPLTTRPLPVRKAAELLPNYHHESHPTNTEFKMFKCRPSSLLTKCEGIQAFNRRMAITTAFQALFKTSASLKPSHKVFFPWHHAVAISIIEAVLVIQEYSRSVKFLLSCLWHWANFKSAGAFLGSSFSTSELNWPDKSPYEPERISVVICHDFSHAWISLEVGMR